MYFDMHSGALPDGLELCAQPQNCFDGIILRGTPTKAGRFTFSFDSQFYNSSWWRVTYTIVVAARNVSPPPPLPTVQPTVSIATTATNGTGIFGYTLTNVSGATDSVTVTTAGVTAHSLTVHTGSVNAAVAIRQSSVPAGWSTSPVSVSCVDSNAGASGNGSGNLATVSGDTASLPASVLRAKAIIQCNFANTAPSVAPARNISGQVFNDNGLGGGTANDGVPNGREAGLPDVAVALGNCTNVVYATARSDSSGHYSLPVPASVSTGNHLCVDAAQTSAHHATGGSVGAVQVQGANPTSVGDVAYVYNRSGSGHFAFDLPNTGTAAVGVLHLGVVPHSTLASDGLKTGLPGSVVSHAHIFRAETSGTVTFSVSSSVSTPAQGTWFERIFADPACVGTLNPDAPQQFVPAVPVSVTAGQKVCVILQESIPQQATAGSRNVAQVRAALVFANTWPALTAAYFLQDVTTVSSAAVDLLKEVRNVSQSAPAFATNNLARPGETLEYRIRFTNNAPSPLRQLVINDSTPSYTRFIGATSTSIPASLSTCVKVTPAAPGAVECTVAQQPTGGTGAVSWTFDGTLEPGATGEVRFSVIVD